MKFTILGSNGFIGSNLVTHLQNENFEVNTPKITEIGLENLGHVIYCIGITSDFREKPFETVNSHVTILNDFLKDAEFDSFLYLSSTRIYMNSSSTEENSLISVSPESFTELYNISKIMGEAICFASDKPNVRIVRLSNVIGNNFESNDFLFSLIRDAVEKKEINLHTKLNSEKDYIDVEDVAKILSDISTKGKNKIYNVAKGENFSVKDIVDILKKITQCQIKIADDAVLSTFEKINIKNLQNEFKFEAKSIQEVIQDLVIKYRDNYSK